MIVQGEKYLITTDNWFIAPDGEQYRSAWGRVYIKNTEDTLGISTNRGSTNWYAVVGSNNKEIIIAGCQIHYSIKCPQEPKTLYSGATYLNKTTGLQESASKIYIAE